MRLVTRFASLFLLSSCVAFLVASWFAARREVRRADERTGADVVAFAEVLEAGVLLSHRAGGPKAAADFVSRTGARSPSIQASLALDSSPGEASSHVTEQLGHRVLRHVRFIELDRGALAKLEVVHPLPSQSDLMRVALGEELLFALVLGLIVSLLALGLGHVLIGRPLVRVVAQARRIANEDFTARLVEDRRDEIGELKRELNTMCDKLMLARKRLDDEATAHVETLEQLRHLDRIRTVGTLSAAVAHELGTPFNVVLLRAESLLDGGATEEDRHDAARVISAQVKKMSATVRQLLDFSRADDQPPTEVSLSTLLRDVEKLLGPLAKKHGISLSARGSDGDVHIRADRLRLEQAITNLVMNAVAASSAGGRIELRLSMAEGVCRRPGADPIDAARVDVVDQGTGMSRERLARIFEPFYTTKAEGVGTGLGLTVACGIAEEHGGFLTAESKLGHGSTFSIYLPVPMHE